MNLLAFTPIEMLGDAGRYLYGLYFMVSLITTIAYGDIIGKNAFEEVSRRLFVGLCLVFDGPFYYKLGSDLGAVHGSRPLR